MLGKQQKAPRRGIPCKVDSASGVRNPDELIFQSLRHVTVFSMHNVLILGTGRSGSSMLTGCFRNTGAYLGGDLLKASSINPYGFYESVDVNELNNRLIHQILYPFRSRRIISFLHGPPHREWRAYWLAAPLWIRRIRISDEIERGIIKLVNQQPFCFKDPRFSVTLSIWERYLPPGTKYIVVFRDPIKTVNSIMRSGREGFVPPLTVSQEWCFTLYARTYRRLLDLAAGNPDWFFVDSEEMMRDDSICRAIESFVETSLDFSEIDASVRKSRNSPIANNKRCEQCLSLYEQLRSRARTDCAQLIGTRS
jgi:hypothetical protein